MQCSSKLVAKWWPRGYESPTRATPLATDEGQCWLSHGGGATPGARRSLTNGSRWGRAPRCWRPVLCPVPRHPSPSHPLRPIIFCPPCCTVFSSCRFPTGRHLWPTRASYDFHDPHRWRFHGQLCLLLPDSAPSGPKWPQIGENGQKQSRMAKSGKRAVQHVVGEKWPKVAKGNPKKSGQSRQKWPKSSQTASKECQKPKVGNSVQKQSKAAKSQ